MDASTNRIDIPNDERAGFERVVALLGGFGLGSRSVIVLASSLDCKRPRSLDEAHRVRGQRTALEGRVGRKRLSPRRKFGHQEAHLVGIGLATAG